MELIGAAKCITPHLEEALPGEEQQGRQSTGESSHYHRLDIFSVVTMLVSISPGPSQEFKGVVQIFFPILSCLV